MNKCIFLFLFIILDFVASAQKDTQNVYSPDYQYNNFKNKLNLSNSILEIKTNNNERGLKIDITENTFDNYNTLTRIADSIFRNHNYALANLVYLKAIQLNNNLGRVKHRYNLACSLAATGRTAEAFDQLEIMITKGKFFDKKLLENEKLLLNLKKEERWGKMIGLIELNLKKIQDSLNFETNQRRK